VFQRVRRTAKRGPVVVDTGRIALAERITFNGMVRIIAGEHRGRRILGPRGVQLTRPMTDRVKESLFNRLRAREGLHGHVLDLFAGTGTLGLESLSRGVKHCTFVERDRGAVGLLRRNLQELGLEDRATVCRVDAFATAWTDLLGNRPLRLILCDPPYLFTSEPSGMQRVISMIEALESVTAPGGLLMLRTQRKATVGSVGRWCGPEQHPYGSMTLSFYQRVGAGSEGVGP